MILAVLQFKKREFLGAKNDHSKYAFITELGENLIMWSADNWLICKIV